MKIASKCRVKKTWAVQLQSRMKGYLHQVSYYVPEHGSYTYVHQNESQMTWYML